MSRPHDRTRFVRLVDYDPRWIDRFTLESEKIAAVFGENLRGIHHIGSTAIPGIKAKPTIDILADVADIGLVDDRNDAMRRLGYRAFGEFGVTGRRFFQKGTQEPEFNLHVYESGNPEIKQQIGFRDYLIAHRSEALAYSQLKQELAQKYPRDIHKYASAKSSFVEEISRKALAC